MLPVEIIESILIYFCHKDKQSIIHARLLSKYWKERIDSIYFGKDCDEFGAPKSGFFQCIRCNRIDSFTDERWAQFASGKNDHFCSKECFNKGETKDGLERYKRRKLE
jgi:hypothetical protein